MSNTDAFAGAITEALAQPWTDPDEQRVRRYAQFHSVENYQKVSSQLVRRGLNDPTDS